MPAERLPATVATLYSELLEQAIAFERIVGLEGQLPGGVVSKELRGRRYLYWQVRVGARVVQRYLGADSEGLRDALRELSERQRSAAAQRESIDRLGAMLLQGGVEREQAAVVGLLRLLADLGLFRRGAVLVGTQAFRAYGALLGVRLPQASLRTQDIDIAAAIDIAMASVEEGPVATEGALAHLRMLPVPGLDPRQPSTSYTVRGRELRLDFLTPARRGMTDAPVPVPGLGLSAWPLRGLDYLIERPVPAVIVDAAPVLVRVPRPGRFALHKLWTAASRPVTEQTKAGKDRAQAAALIDVLAEERPDDLAEARAALGGGRTMRRTVERELERLGMAPS